MNFIITQILGGISLLLVVISYFCKNKKAFLMLQMIANVFYGLSFIFSNGLVFGINNFISIIRIIVLCIYEKKNIKPPVYLIIPFVTSYLTVGIIFYQQPIDIIGIIAPMLFTLAMWVKNMQFVRILMLLPNVMLVFSAVFYSAYTTALLDTIEVVAIIVSFVIYYRKRNTLKWLV